MNEVKLLNIGVVPEAAVSGAVVTQTEYSTFVTFNAMRENKNGMRENAGTALIEFKLCLLTKFGYPNDEAWEGHPLYSEFEKAGGAYDFYEVVNSSWLSEINKQNKKAFPDFSYETRHFVIFFHDSTFECLASDFEVQVFEGPFTSVWEIISERIANE